MEIRTVEIAETGEFRVNKNVDENDDREIVVPDDMSNRHRIMIQKWIDVGNTPTPFGGATDMELCMAEISHLESTVTPRRMRDAFANKAGKDWVANVESLIAIERGKL